jgi:NAD(P)-dependent dehydrogenase (short-subunit alcohol dehydrogenase family)
MPDFDLTGQVAVVTGASRGIGRSLALAMAHRGAAIVGTARTLEGSAGQGGTLAGLVDEIVAMGGRATAMPAEITDPAGAEEVVGRAVAEYGRIDVLLNNAGTFPHVTIRDMTPEAWQDIINVNAVFYLCHHTLPVMMAQRSGRIVNVTSYLGTYYHPTHVAYSATKAAVDRLSMNLAQEVAEYGIQVNAWAPGLTATDMTGGRGEDVQALEEPFLWLLTPEATSYTGNIARRDEFNKTWGPISHA